VKKPSALIPFLVALMISVMLSIMGRIFLPAGMQPSRLVVCSMNLGVSSTIIPASEAGSSTDFTCLDQNGDQHPYSQWVAMLIDAAIYFVILSIGFFFIFLSSDKNTR
jgi:hypothetical protein